MLPLRHWSVRRLAALWLAALLLEAALVAGVRTYSNAVFAREHAALVAGSRRRDFATADSTRDHQLASDSTAGVRFDHRMRNLIATQEAAVAMMLVVALAAAGITATWSWLRVRGSGATDAAPAVRPAPDAPEQPTS